MKINTTEFFTKLQECKEREEIQSLTSALVEKKGGSHLFDILNSLRIEYSEDKQVIEKIASVLSTSEIINDRMFHGLVLALLGSDNDAAILEIVKGIQTSNYNYRFLYELENININNRPGFVINFIAEVITEIKDDMQKQDEYKIREQTRMTCDNCGDPTDTKCVACGRGICKKHIAYDAPEGYYCKKCQDIKVANIRTKFQSDNEDKERITSIKVGRISNDKKPRD